MNTDLIKKYNVPGPRYTSYPTVPYWDKERPAENDWKLRVKKTFQSTNNSDGISVYIHLPYCESLCTYCGCNTRITKNHLVEKPYILAVLNEWSMYLDVFEETPRISELHLGGGTPTFFSPENLKSLIEGLTSTAVITKNATFSFEGHPGNTTEQHLKVLADLGFNRVSYGIQDFDEKVQEAIHRFQTVEEVSWVTTQSKKFGYDSVNYDLVYGLPFQTLDGITRTLDEVIKLRPDRIAFYSYAHVPWVKPGQRKFTELDLPAPDEKRAMYEKGREMFELAGYKEIGMDHFALPGDELMVSEMKGELHRNFMGYTSKHTKLLVGLGVSSISDCETAYVQNEKKVEDYIALVNKGNWPFFKGHLLSDEDLIIRKHISNLMCRFSTSWDDEKMQTEAWYEGLERLSEFVEDGLLLHNPYSIQVTQLGRNFIRNICMSFDAKLWRNLPTTELFSSTV
ncbi:MAG: oxygen-independent coproporphyrinogen III oxidase [Bacteroidia bacterium]